MSALAWAGIIAGVLVLIVLLVWGAVLACRQGDQSPDVRASSSVKDFPLRDQPRDTLAGRDNAQLHLLLHGLGIEMPFNRIKDLSDVKFHHALLWATNPVVPVPKFLAPYVTGRRS
jgi:hypothetical protein